MNAREMLIKARAGLVLHSPFWGHLALKMELVEDRTIETACTNGITLRYNPEFIGSLPLEEVKGVVAHEAAHPMCGHHTRRGSRDSKQWNYACDLAINPLLEESGFVLPAGALRGSQFKDMYAEQIYNLLPPPDPDGGGQGDNDNDPGGCGGVEDAPGKDGSKATPSEMAQAEQDWKVAVAQAAAQAKGCGPLPGGVQRLVDELLNPKISWIDMLPKFIDEAARNDYNWSSPNRRYMQQGLYLPCLKSNELRSVVLMMDTSGSIGREQISQFGAELSGILEEFDTTCVVIYADSEVAGVEEFTRNDLPLDLHPAGGGGTDFKPAFQYVEDHGINPSCAIYLTDGDCFGGWPDDPGYPVLWVGTKKFEPPFGDFVELN